MEEKYIIKLANDLLFEPNEEVIALAKNLLSSIDQSLKELDKFDLDAIKPLSHINEKYLSFDLLREDTINEEKYISKQNLLANAANKNDEFVIMKKVV